MVFQEVRQMFVYVGSCLICTIYQKMAELWASVCLLSQVIVNIITDILSPVIPHVMSTHIQDGHGVKLTNPLFCSNHLYFRHSQYFLVISLLYFWSASVLWTLEHYMRCNTQSSDMGWHPLCHPTLSFLTSETRINIYQWTHTTPGHHQEGSCLFVYIYSITGIKEFCQSQVKRESIYLLMLLTTSSSSEWLSNCYNSHLDPVLQSEQCCIRQTFCLMPR